MNGQNRKDIYPGLAVAIILKKDQRNGQAHRIENAKCSTVNHHTLHEIDSEKGYF